jgi:hypothetical protein
VYPLIKQIKDNHHQYSNNHALPPGKKEYSNGCGDLK